ncbi:hypothetical protein IEQ34_023915 [Dendrobium chrysotoxum]|uniref:Uncharacterized protein n=1 Tax=Dendrobium chrysotoxum TaxID=161865 RepID=A0AAV7FUZ6_DENCH|nr:hypothetical protein IEQ34_023915 [Dendrobium chrysotoxum]
MHLHSFDLQAATDTLPAVLTTSMLIGLFGQSFAESWLFLMTVTGFRVPERTKGKNTSNRRVYHFTKGAKLQDVNKSDVHIHARSEEDGEWHKKLNANQI